MLRCNSVRRNANYYTCGKVINCANVEWRTVGYVAILQSSFGSYSDPKLSISERYQNVKTQRYWGIQTEVQQTFEINILLSLA